MEDAKKEMVTEFFSEPGGANWISPVYDDESRRYIAEDLVGKHIMDNEEYDPADEDEGYMIVDLFSGSSLLDKEILDRYHTSEVPVNIKAIDMNPPEYAMELGEEYDSLEVIEGDVLEELEEIDDADGIVAIDGFQELDDEEMFGGEESKGLADSIYDSLNEEASLIFNSIYGLTDLFEELGESANEDIDLLREDDKGRSYIHAESVTIEELGVTTPIHQTPRPYEEYRSEFEKRGLEEVESGEIEADTSSVPDVVKSIDADIPIPNEENINVSYKYGVMRKGGS